ncbi:hypothetical protein M9H77_07263 [Catharanthus roseus]|uniref:Uncharacterized protein n=1 Tax=Catharanthus roseus TaxID=4058 RepID=A0ACC0BUF6_CATRO|nr:hypothetical protein M9H77_07263 [Catharanthus roseus]
MEAKSKQENYQSKIARDMHNFYHGGGNGFNAYGGNNHRNGNFSKRHNGVHYFSYYAKSFEVNTRYDNYEHNPYDCYEKDLFKEIKLFSLVFMENGYQFYFPNSLGNLIQKKQFIEFNSNSCAIPRVYKCHFNISNYVSYVLGIEDKGRNMEKELGNFLKDLPINNASFVEPNIVCLKLECALIDVLHDKSIGKYVDRCDYVISIFGIFMRNINGFILFNQHVILFSKKIAFVSEQDAEALDLPSMVGPAPTIAGRLLPAKHLEDRNLPQTVNSTPAGLGKEIGFVIFRWDFIV